MDRAQTQTAIEILLNAVSIGQSNINVSAPNGSTQPIEVSISYHPEQCKREVPQALLWIMPEGAERPVFEKTGRPDLKVLGTTIEDIDPEKASSILAAKKLSERINKTRPQLPEKLTANLVVREEGGVTSPYLMLGSNITDQTTARGTLAALFSGSYDAVTQQYTIPGDDASRKSFMQSSREKNNIGEYQFLIPVNAQALEAVGKSIDAMFSGTQNADAIFKEADDEYRAGLASEITTKLKTLYQVMGVPLGSRDEVTIKLFDYTVDVRLTPQQANAIVSKLEALGHEMNSASLNEPPIFLHPTCTSVHGVTGSGTFTAKITQDSDTPLPHTLNVYPNPMPLKPNDAQQRGGFTRPEQLARALDNAIEIAQSNPDKYKIPRIK